jgi:hypothetical protein
MFQKTSNVQHRIKSCRAKYSSAEEVAIVATAGYADFADSKDLFGELRNEAGAVESDIEIRAD